MSLHRAAAFILVSVVSLASEVSGQAPRALVQGPVGMAPQDYFRLAGEARQFEGERNWHGAAEAYARLTEAYPWQPLTWYRLGIALYNTAEYAGAAAAFARAGELGVPAEARGVPRLAALAFMRAGEPESALAWIEKALLEYRYERPMQILQDTVFNGLRAHPRFRRLTAPEVDSSASRVEGWRTDLDYMLEQIRRFDPEYSRRPLPDSVTSAAERLRRQIPALSDMQVILKLQELAAMLGHSHTGIGFGSVPSHLSGQEHPIPLSAYLFPGGLHIIRADSVHRELVGSRVLEIEGLPVDSVLDRVRALTPAEGDPFRAFSPDFVFASSILHAMGLAEHPDRLRLTVSNGSTGSRTLDISAAPGYPWQDHLSPSPLTSAPSPLYLSRPKEPYWFEHLPEHDAVYVRFQRVRDQPGESLSAFGLRLRRFLAEQNDIRSVVVDLRGNSGGNSYLYPELLRTIIAFDAQEGRRTSVLIDRKVLSAPMNFAVDLERMTNAVFIGEPTGAPPEQFGDAIDLVFPYSRISFRIPSVVWNLSSPRDDRRWIAPDVPVALTAEDYFANRDPVLRAALGIHDH